MDNGQTFFHPRTNARARLIAPQSLVALCFLFASLALVSSSFAQIVGSAQLNVERRAHTATLLDYGKVLIVGGDNQNGMVGQAELLDPVAQTSSLGASLTTARTDHSATKLADGRVLVIGGRDSIGSLTSTEIFDPSTTAFAAGPSLTTPRSGHSATVLSDGTILIAGGDATGSAEIYDPLAQTFSLVTGSMNSARRLHSAIVASTGQVLIVGGVDAQNTVLKTAEVYDPASQSFYLPPTDLKTPRALATLKLLSDGKVQVIGGDADSTMEVFDPELGWFNALALLPPTVDSLNATLSTQSRAALISPDIAQDPFLQGVLTAEQLALLDRADHSITELPAQNQALVAGGINSSGQILNSATLVSSSSASITTDKTDYSPGTVVTITGKGFQSNENVEILLHEAPEGYPDPAFVATADDQGSFTSMQFSPQTIDIGRTFTLTAIGQKSGYTAQTAFMDANAKLTVTVTGNGKVDSSPAGIDNCRSGSPAANCFENYTITSPALNVTLTPTADAGSVFVSWGGACSGAGSCTVAMSADKTVTATFNSTVPTTLSLAAPSPASVSLGSSGPVTLSATLTRTTGGAAVSGATITFKLDGTSVGTAVTNGSGVASITTYNPSALAAGSHNVTAEFATATISSITYESSTSNTETLNVTVPTSLSLAAPSPASVSLGSSGPVTLSATLTRTTGGAAVSGATITFKVDGSSVGTAVTNASGVASITTYNPSALTAGSHNVTAEFAGATISSVTYESSNSGTQTLNVTVPTTLTLAAPSPASVSLGSSGPVTLSATLTQTTGGAAVSGATITFKVDGSSVGTAVTNASGVASITTYNPSALTAGSHNVTAEFAGATISSITYESSNSGTQTLTVVAPPTISKAFGVTTVAFGSTTSLTFTISNPVANTVGQTGVAFTDTLPSGLKVATPNGLSQTCTGTVTAVTGSGSVSLASGILADDAVCTISINVLAVALGAQNNTTGNISSTQGGTGTTSNTATITVGKASTTSTVTVTPSTQQYSDKVTFEATLSPDQVLTQVPATGVTFYVGAAGLNDAQVVAQAQNMGSCTLAASSGVLSCKVENVALLEPSFPPPAAANMASGSHTVYAIFTGVNTTYFTVNTATTGLTITKEDVVVTPSGSNPTNVPGVAGGQNTVAFTLAATFQDKNDGNPGVIDLAKMASQPYFVIKLSSITTATTYTCGSVTVTGAGGSGGSLTASCSFPAGTVNVDVYEVTFAVNSANLYYTGGTDDVLSVADPSLSATGGGWFYWPGTSDKTNYGFTMKYTQKGIKPQGSALVIRHRSDGTLVKMKSNAIKAVSVGIRGTSPDTYGWGTLTGKATYDDTADTLDKVGGMDFTLYAEDWNEPGTRVDKFWVSLTGYPLLTLPSPNPDLTDNAIEINNGNIAIPHVSGGKR